MNEIWVNLDEIFMWVARASLYAVAVIAVVVLVQALTRRVLAAKWICALWIILLLRLIIPAGPESGLSLWNLAPRSWMQQTFSEPDSAPVISDVLVTFEPSAAENEAALLPRWDFSAFWHTLRTFLPGVWLAGALLMMCGILIGDIRLWNTVRRLPFVADHALLALLEECRQSMRIWTVVGLVVTDRVKSPLLFGFIRPRILLPADLARELPPERLRYILLHELAHLKRRDILTGWILAFLQALHWFNPLVWWAFGRIRFDRELACDEQVLSRVLKEDRRDYGDVLVGMLERFNHIHHLPAIAGILENKDQLKRRLIMIKKFRRPARREIIAFAALLSVLSIALLTESLPLLSRSINEQSADIQIVNAGHRTIRIHLQEVGVAHYLDGPRYGRSDHIYLFGPGDKKDDIEQLASKLKERINAGEGTTDILNFLEFERMQDDSLLMQDGTTIKPGDRIFLQGGTIYGAVAKQDELIMLCFGEISPEALATEHMTAIKYNIKETYGSSINTQTDLTATPNSEQEFTTNGQDGKNITDRIRLPKVLTSPKPYYTEEARTARIEGLIVLKAVIRKDGTVDNVEVVQGLGYGLDEAAIEAVMTEWRFKPATLNGEPIEHPATIEVSFALR